jgi:voltage-gated sodium channel
MAASEGSRGVSRAHKVLDQYFPPRESSNDDDADSIFTNIMSAVIVFNCLQIGAECQWNERSSPGLWRFFTLLDLIFCAFYVAEVVCKLIKLRLRFFTVPAHWGWNITDLTLTLSMMLDLAAKFVLPWHGLRSKLRFMRMLRVVRIIRIIRVLRQIPSLTVCVGGILGSLTTLCWIVTVMVILIYTFAIFFFMEVEHDSFENPSDDLWRDLFTGMATLTDIVVFARWTETLPPSQPILLLPFLMFIMLGAFGVTNVIIGVMVDATSAVKTALDWESDRKHLLTCSILWDEEITKRRIRVDDIEKLQGEARERKLQERASGLKEVLKMVINSGTVDFPAGVTAEDLLYIFDEQGDGQISHEEFTLSLGRLLLSDPFQARVISLLNQGLLKRQINETHVEVIERIGLLERVLQQDTQRIGTIEQMLITMQSDMSEMKQLMQRAKR